MLRICTGESRGIGALRLQGPCSSPTDALYLQEAMQQVLQRRQGSSPVWVDCAQLESLTWQGQRALLSADQLARARGVVVYWCAIPAPVREQLAESGLLAVLHVLAATSYQGVLTLLPPPGAIRPR